MTQHIRCAIYTRKSSEEGLEQSFNSLHSQREACEAYILSQKHEGWHAIKAHYDDGGFSGGSMGRPALQKLLADIGAGKVDVVVVYKVDRLTRSLLDFSKIIGSFDAKAVSFVSVTQQFNTTSSMGRLTLNVLLSFAQFEREVTGERIRDKVAASKKKGMWMGGTVPLGYDIQDRRLVINTGEAKVVRDLFEQYVRLGRVTLLQQYAREHNIVGKIKRGTNASPPGGKCFARGALYHLLKNRIYIGEIVHKDKAYPGQHEAIIDRQTWDKAAVLLAQNNKGNRKRGSKASGSLLTGILFDSAGNRYTPTHAVKNGKRYRYYTSQAAINGRRLTNAPARVPAHEIEKVVIGRIKSLLRSPEELQSRFVSAGVPPKELGGFMPATAESGTDDELIPHCRSILLRVVVSDGAVELKLAFRSNGIGGTNAPPADVGISVETEFATDLSSHQLRLVVTPGREDPTNEASPLMKAIARARLWHSQLVSGEFHNLEQIAVKHECSPNYVSRIFSLCLLSPRMVEGIAKDLSSERSSIESYCFRSPVWSEQKA